MASQPEVSDVSSTFERLIRSRDMSLFLPFIFGFSSTLQRADASQEDQPNDQQPQDQDQTNDQQTNDNRNRNRVILINPFTQGMVVIEGSQSLDSLLRELGNKGGPEPAARSAIDALPRVEISEDCGDQECSICLEEFEVGGFAKEMPCKHRFHGGCIEKWLGIHGSCPVCRHKMPVDESKRRGFEREIWVSFSFNGGTRSGTESQDSDQSPSGHHDDDDGSSNGDEVQG